MRWKARIVGLHRRDRTAVHCNVNRVDLGGYRRHERTPEAIGRTIISVVTEWEWECRALALGGHGGHVADVRLGQRIWQEHVAVDVTVYNARGDAVNDSADGRRHLNSKELVDRTAGTAVSKAQSHVATGPVGF